jgi:hypothetical protein
MLDVYLSAKKTLNPHKRKNCFELFGFDFLIDEDFRVWLIEVNTNPYLGIPNEYIKGVLPKMIDDLFDLVLDPIFDPEKPKRGDNGFDLLYSHQQQINKRRPLDEGLYPVPELAQPRRKVVKPKISISSIRKAANTVDSTNKKVKERDMSPEANTTVDELNQL